MIKITPYKQTDIRWFWKKVGFGGGIFKNVGCTTTALTSLLSSIGYTLRPDEVSILLKKNNGYKGDLILWGVVSKVFPKIKFIYRYPKYDNNIAITQIKKGIPVMVEVMTKYGKHWVLFIGDKMMLDPLSGIVSTSKYPTLTGMAIFDKV